MSNIIPPEIINYEFSEWITKICAQDDVCTILEIGASSGDGSTQQILKGIRQSGTPKQLYSVEIFKDRFQALEKNLSGIDFAHAYRGSTVTLDEHPTLEAISDFFAAHPSHSRVYKCERFLGWAREGFDILATTKSEGLSHDIINVIRKEHGIDTFDVALIDGSEFTGLVELKKVYGAKYLLLDDICTYKNAESHYNLLEDPNYEQLHCNRHLRNGFSVFKRKEGHDFASNTLPVHFFTIVVNGMPFIQHHLESFRKLPFDWHWHIVEGIADLVHDTAWGKRNGGSIPENLHDKGLSVDGTTAYIDEIQRKYPNNITVYRKGGGQFWDGKLEMVNAPLANLPDQAILWQLDSDEIWTTQQIHGLSNLFAKDPSRTAAMFWCHYFVGPELVISTRNCYAQNPAQEWLRAWKYKKGMGWAAHEPPVLCIQNDKGEVVNVASIKPFLHAETEQAGLVFQHFAYTTEPQLHFKEDYYGYKGALGQWKALNSAPSFPIKLRDYFGWVQDGTEVNRCSSLGIRPLVPASELVDSAPKNFTVAFDAVFFQYFQTGIARLWRSIIQEWVKSGFIENVCILDRNGTAPKIQGAHYKRVPPHNYANLQEDRGILESACREIGAKVFISSYYSYPYQTPSVLLLYDMIPEVFKWEKVPMWQEKTSAINNAESLLAISKNTARDLNKFHPGCPVANIGVAYCATTEVFKPANVVDLEDFKLKYGINRPYFLLVGSSTSYKNAQLFFQAFSQLENSKDFDIVRTGSAPFDEELRKFCKGSAVNSYKFSDEDLALAYAGAVALVYPSYYEGFGMPPLEAMACGCPVITCSNSSLPEVCGDAAIYVSPDKPEELVAALKAVQEPATRSKLVRDGLARPKEFSWERSAKIIADRLMSVVEEADSVPVVPQSINLPGLTPSKPKKLDEDGIRELRGIISDDLADASYEEVLLRLESEPCYNQLAADDSHSIAWNDKERDFFIGILDRTRNTAQDEARDFLLAAMYLPLHLLPFQPNLEYIPDSLLSHLLRKMVEYLSGYILTQDMEQKALTLVNSFDYLSRRIAIDPHGEVTNEMANASLYSGIPTPALNQAGRGLRPFMERREAVYRHVLGRNLREITTVPPEGKDPRIAIFCSHVGQGEATPYALTLLEMLVGAGYHCDFICDSSSSIEIQKKAEKLATKNILLAKGIQDASQQIARMGLDMLIYTDPMYDPNSPTYLLAMQRLAKTQVAMPSSLVTTGFEAVDFFIVGKEWTAHIENLDEQFREKVIRVEGLGNAICTDLGLDREWVKISRADIGIEDAQPLFVTAAAPHAITPEVRECWIQVLAGSPNAKMLVMPFLNGLIQEEERKVVVSLLEMAARDIGLPADRLLIMTDLVESASQLVPYLELCDVYLEAFPCHTPFPAAKALEKGVPVVTMEGVTLRESITSGILREQGLADWIVNDPMEYVIKATAAAESKARVQYNRQPVSSLVGTIGKLLEG
jgi:glycosyltransferase involved in cell wall biosynthesis